MARQWLAYARERWSERREERRQDRADSKRWAEADSVGELGELTAQWLEGRVGFHPGGYDVIDPETRELVPALITLNRAGYATIGSQPGRGPLRGGDNDHWWWQRAAVEGFADRDTAERLHEAAEESGLIVVKHGKARWPFNSYRDCVSVTRGSPHYGPAPDDRSWPCTGFGTHLSYKQIDTIFGYRRAQMALYRTPQVVIVDPEWGRNDRLWPTLTSKLTQRVGNERVDPERCDR